MRTGSARCDGEAFEGICACIQYILSLIPRDVFQFGRSEVDPARKLVSGELRQPPNLGIDTSETKVASQR